MSVERYTFDTNILFYSIDSSDAAKHRIARNLVGRANPLQVMLLLQTLGELCNATSRKRPALFAEAQNFMSDAASLFQIASPSLEDLQQAAMTQQEHHVQFWDAVLCSTAHRTGCTLFFSEDLQDGRTLDSLTIRNPFKMAEDELRQLLG